MDVSTWVWWTTIGVTDRHPAVRRRHHRPPPARALDARRSRSTLTRLHRAGHRSSASGSGCFAGHQYGTEFFAGWLTEYSLSVDNLFIFIIIMAKFAVPEAAPAEALLIGIVLALVFRGDLHRPRRGRHRRSSAGSSTSSARSSSTPRSSSPGGRRTTTTSTRRTGSIKWVETALPLDRRSTTAPRCSIQENGKRLITPMFMVILALGTTDLLFALDSIPAIYGLTQEPYLVLTANIFALMGLRQLYFLLGGLLERLVYLVLRSGGPARRSSA